MTEATTSRNVQSRWKNPKDRRQEIPTKKFETISSRKSGGMDQANSIHNSISHRGSFTTVTIYSDSHSFLTGGDDNTAHIWLLSGNELSGRGPPLYHGGSVVSAAFGYDRTVLTGSTDKTARLWKIYNLKTIIPISYPFRHGGSVDCVAMSADSRTVLTGSSDGIARIWNPYLRVRAGIPRVLMPGTALASTNQYPNLKSWRRFLSTSLLPRLQRSAPTRTSSLSEANTTP